MNRADIDKIREYTTEINKILDKYGGRFMQYDYYNYREPQETKRYTPGDIIFIQKAISAKIKNLHDEGYTIDSISMYYRTVELMPTPHWDDSKAYFDVGTGNPSDHNDEYDYGHKIIIVPLIREHYNATMSYGNYNINYSKDGKQYVEYHSAAIDLHQYQQDRKRRNGF